MGSLKPLGVGGRGKKLKCVYRSRKRIEKKKRGGWGPIRRMKRSGMPSDEPSRASTDRSFYHSGEGGGYLLQSTQLQITEWGPLWVLRFPLCFLFYTHVRHVCFSQLIITDIICKNLLLLILIFLLFDKVEFIILCLYGL